VGWGLWFLVRGSGFEAWGFRLAVQLRSAYIELIRSAGTFAEAVFKGEQRSNREEVAVKVVSLQNHAIHDSKWVQEQMVNFRDENGCDPTEEERLNIYRQKVRCISNLNFKTKLQN